MSLKQLPRAYIFFVILVAIFLAAGCESDGNDAPVADLQAENDLEVANPTRPPPATSTPMPTQTPLPSATPTVTNTPSPTPTPTPTAVPINVIGDPRSALLSDPQPQDSARCGIVDILDFPLDPPDALSVSYGGEGFGRFRGRYDQYHAGEDWQLTRGRTNLGVPVYAIGHGRVTYAQPLGWGRDQGVIIIRHTFEDGSTVLSFYGHMDPDSVYLRAGDCVERGQKIAEIGQPRTPPHLHFEIRTHMPDEPGPGYWPVDPTEAGWLPPSQFIWDNRMASSPGVIWTQAAANTGLPAINLINDETVINISENQVLGLNIADGQMSWQTTLTETVVSAALDQIQPLLYTADWSGQIAAYKLDDMVDGASSMPEAPFWQRDSRLVGAPRLHPLSGGGLVVSVREDLLALSDSGEVLWREELEQRPFDWLESSDHLLMTVSDRQGPIYSLDASGLQVWPFPFKGRLVESNDRLWLYAEEGLYLLDMETMDAQLVHQLPPSLINIGSIVALPNGGVLIAHQEIGDSRLISFAADGSVLWQRSYSQLDGRDLRLLIHNNRPYLLMQSGSGLSTTVELYALDIQDSTLRHIFTGGLRSSTPNDSWMVNANNDLILIDVGGSSFVALDPDTSVSLLDSSAN